MLARRVIVAIKDPLERREIREMLARAGFSVIQEAGDGRRAAQFIFQLEPDVAVLDAFLPGRSGFEIARVVGEHRVAPVVLLLPNHEWETLEEAKKAAVYAYLVKPVDKHVLLPAVELALVHHSEMLKLEAEMRKLKDQLKVRKVVEKAKGLLVEFRQMSEKEAYSHIRRMAMDKCMSMVKVAEGVIAEFADDGK